MTRLRHLLLLAAAGAVLTACGGGGSSDPSTTATGGSTGTGTGTGTSATATGASCTGTATSTAYDVYLNTALGITQSTASRQALRYGAASDAGQCIDIAGSTAQGDITPGAFRATTTDAWNAAIAYADPSATPVAGGERYDQGLLVTCTGGNDTFRHVAVRNPAGASTFVATSPLATVAKDVPLANYACAVTGSSTAPTLDSGSSVVFSSTTGAVTVTDGANGSTTIPAASVASLFTSAGYRLGSNAVLRWYLYQLPVGTASRQVLVSTNQRADGTYNIGVYVSP